MQKNNSQSTKSTSFIENPFIKIIRSVWFKSLLLLIAAGILLLSFTITLSRFNSTDPEPRIQDIDIELTKRFAEFTVHIETGLFIRNFSHFDILRNKFVVDTIVWFLFDPAEITLDTINKFSFENGRIINKSPPDVKIIESKTFVKYNVTVEVKSNLEYYRFPLEDHKLSLVLINNFVTPYEVMFEVLSTDFVIAPKIFIANWKIKNLNTNFGIDEDILNQIDQTKKIAYPKASFIIDLVKAGIRKAFIIFVPIFIVFFFALFSFFLTVGNFIGKTTLSLSGLTALLGYRFVIEGMMPKVGYFTTTDYVYIILLAFAFLIFLFNVISTRMYNTLAKKIRVVGYTEDHLTLANDIMFIFIVCLSVSMLGFVILL